MNEMVVYDQHKVDLISRTIAKGSTPDELALFVQQCRRTGLDPFARQIYSIERRTWNNETKQAERQMVTQISIDGARLIAERTGKYGGQLGPYWCGKDGEWVDVWLRDEPPVAAKVGIVRTDWHEPLWAVARYAAYAQTKKDGTPTQIWAKMGDHMTAKCAEMLGLRRSFPQELSGLYTAEEMGDDEVVVVVEQPAPAPQPNGNGKANGKPKAGQDTLNQLHAAGRELYGDQWDSKRHELVRSVSKGATESSKDLTEAEAQKLIAGMVSKLHALRLENEEEEAEFEQVPA